MTLRHSLLLTPWLSLIVLGCGSQADMTASERNAPASPDGEGISGGGGAGGGGASTPSPSIEPGSAGSAGSSGAAMGGTGATAGTAGAAGTAGTAGAPDPGPVPGQPGTLTAGAWDDNRNFDFFSSYRAAMKGSGIAGLLPFSDGEHQAAHDAFADQLASHQTLDVALVIDTTGSMTDEIAYLRSEFLALSSSIEDAYPNANQRWSLIVYRDQGDAYVVRAFDFSTDLARFQATLAAQEADGGGDVPEAPDQALAATATLAWRSAGTTARLAFWVADAPHHAGRAAQMADAVRAVESVGVHLYPVASSGVDELTELSMRSAAQLTGGRYLFLTDDSGVGGAHKEPTLPCYFVTRLDHAILRMVDIELSGVYREPAPAEIIRTGGDPHGGTCELDSGSSVVAY